MALYVGCGGSLVCGVLILIPCSAIVMVRAEWLRKLMLRRGRSK